MFRLLLCGLFRIVMIALLTGIGFYLLLFLLLFLFQYPWLLVGLMVLLFIISGFRK